MAEKTPIWYPTMGDEERTELLAEYKPEDHLISWNKGGEALIYYPSAWRLYELRLRFPNAMIDTDIYHFDQATGFVILVSFIYVGECYDKAKLRAKAFKQGYASKLDSLQTMCESRAARNFGISPTLALDMEDSEVMKVAIRSEEEHQARKNAANKRTTPTRQAAPATDGSQAAPRPAPASTLDAKRTLAHRMAQALNINESAIDKMDEAHINDFIADCKRENALATQAAKAQKQQESQAAPEPKQQEQAQPATRMQTNMDGMRKLAHQWAQRLKVGESAIDKMDKTRLQDFIDNCKQEYKLAKQSAKAEAEAQAAE